MSINKLYKKVNEVGPIYVGLDPNLNNLPDFVKDLSIEDKILNIIRL